MHLCWCSFVLDIQYRQMFIAANSITELQWYGKARIWIAFETRINFPFTVCLIILLPFTALEHSARWYGAVSKGNSETLQEFSFLCVNISLQHTDFEIQESSRAYSKSHLKLRNFTPLAYKGLHTTSLHSFDSDCVSKWTRAGCVSFTVSTTYTCRYHWGQPAASVPRAVLASSLPLLSSWERGGQKSSMLSPQCTGHCVPVMAVLQTHQPLSIFNAQHPDSTATHSHRHAWQFCVYFSLSKRRITHKPWAPNKQEDAGA